MNRFRLKATLLLVLMSHLATGCTLNTPNVISDETVPAPGFTSQGQYYYYLESQLQRKRGNLDQALALLKRAIELDPQTLYLQRELAVLLLQKKDEPSALQTLESILQAAPDDIDTLILYGRTQQGLKKNAEAIETFRRVIALDPRQENIYLLLGNLFMESNACLGLPKYTGITSVSKFSLRNPVSPARSIVPDSGKSTMTDCEPTVCPGVNMVVSPGITL